MAKTTAGGHIAPNNSPQSSGGGGASGAGGHGKGSFAPGGRFPHSPSDKMGRAVTHKPYPHPVRGGGSVGTGNSQSDSPAGKPTAHPMSRKPTPA